MDPKLKMILSQVQKPGRYTGGEPGCVYKEQQPGLLRFAFCFPDTYELGMSFLGMKILYEKLNQMSGVWCERAFMPWIDMADILKKESYPLFALESLQPLSSFDMLGFTLQYELSYTNILAMLDLSNIPFRAADRGEEDPLIIAGGPCVCNAEPLADFFDCMLLGEGEEQTPVICSLVSKAKKENIPKAELLLLLAEIPGVYVPSLYTVAYLPNGKIESVTAQKNAPAKVQKALLKDFANYPLPTNFVVPMIGAIHDRAQVEVLRGCARGCRFCQAGFIYRPMRERDAAMLSQSAEALCTNTGYEEVGLMSLSTSDHSELEVLLDDMLEWTTPKHINLSLPSLRVDNFSESLVQKVSKVRKSGLTFAPEAGTQRLRDVINKNVSDEEIERTCTLAFGAGYSSVKLYFMMGLPTETMEDIKGIADTAQRIVDLYYTASKRKKGPGVRVSISVACFVPKPNTPFQYCAQESMELLKQKQAYLLECVHNRKINISYHDSRISFLEAVFAKGDRRLSAVLEHAYKMGCRFDGWDDQFRFDVWMQVFEDLGIDPHFYANRNLEFDEVYPWSHLDFGVSEAFLRSEFVKSTKNETTPPCNLVCSGCGANQLLGGPCFAYN